MTALLVDCSGQIYRAFYGSEALDPGFRYRSDGHPIAAARDFFESLLYLHLRGIWHRERHELLKFDRIAMVFDAPGAGWRHGIYPAYKSNRPPRPDDLQAQMPLFRRGAEALGFEVIEAEGYEADDILATYAKAIRDEGDDVLIYTQDKDLMQVVRQGVELYRAGRGREGHAGFIAESWVREPQVQAKFGVLPIQVPEVQALMGDTADGVPGVPGCGQKTAAKWVNDWGTVEGVLAMRHRLQGRFRDYLNENEALVRIARQLVTLDDDAPVPVPIDRLATPTVDLSSVHAFAEELEAPLLARRAEEMSQVTNHA